METSSATGNLRLARGTDGTETQKEQAREARTDETRRREKKTSTRDDSEEYTAGREGGGGWRGRVELCYDVPDDNKTGIAKAAGGRISRFAGACPPGKIKVDAHRPVGIQRNEFYEETVS